MYGEMLPYDLTYGRRNYLNLAVYSVLAFLLIVFLMQAIPAFAANSAFTGVGSTDEDFKLYKEKMGKAFTLAYNVGVIMAGLYYVSAVIRYFAEDSGDAARKHLIGAGCALFIAVSALPIVNFVLNGFFPTSAGYQSISDGTTAVKLGVAIFRKMLTLMFDIGIAMGVVYFVVAALKYSFSSDGGTTAKNHLIRVLFGIFLVIIGRTVINAFFHMFGG